MKHLKVKKITAIMLGLALLFTMSTVSINKDGDTTNWIKEIPATLYN